MRARRVVVAALVVALGVGGDAALPVRRQAAPAAQQTYVVKSGDSLDKVARRFGTSVSALAQANRLRNVNVVRIGQRLVVPPRPVATSGLPQKVREDAGRRALIRRFDHWAKTYGVPPDLLKAMTWMESGWQNHKRSPVGAYGIGQLMPDTVQFVNRNLLRTNLDPGRPDDNIRMSARFLRYLLDRTDGDTSRALAAYYQGLRSLREQGFKPGTQEYVTAILTLRARFR